MPPTRSFINLAFRVHLKPAPRTQSESNAILRALQDLGPISMFQIEPQSLAKPSDPRYRNQDHTTANLVFAYNTKTVESLRSGGAEYKLSVIANANIPDARVLDPYNVRGLKSRKPELPPRTFQCRIVPTERLDQSALTNASPLLEDGLQNEYSTAFAVDRGSIFGEILAKTDCPSGLIHGLLPRLDESSRTLTRSVRADNSPEEPAEHRTAATMHGSSQATNSASLRETRMSAETQGSESNGHSHNRVSKLSNLKLMQMYRDATSSGDSQQHLSSTMFSPFSDRD